MDRIKNLMKKAIKSKKSKIIIIIVIILFMLLPSSVYFLTIDVGTYKEGDWTSTPYGAKVYESNVQINKDGTISSGKKIEEIWNQMIENGNRVDQYLEGPEELAKLINAEIITQYPDTRKNPDEELNWDNINLLEDKLQGIIKFKRATTDGKISSLKYVDVATFYGWIEDYNMTGNENSKNNVLSHFTVKEVPQTNSVKISPDDITTELSNAIIESAKATPSPGKGVCLGWVNNVYQNAGVSPDRKGTAYEAFLAHCISTDMENIPVGAAVYSTGSAGKNGEYAGCGHVGIYVGNGQVMDNIGDIRTISLEKWVSEEQNPQTIDGKRGWLGWGWEGYTIPTEYKKGEEKDSNKNKDEENKEEIVLKSYVAEVATWNQEDTTITTNDPNVEEKHTTRYNMTTTKINYKEVTDRYKMPFDLLWALLVVGEDKNFVFELADLVYNSNIEITIYDNYSKNTNIDRWTYTQEERNEVWAKITEITKKISKSADKFTDIKENPYQTTKTVEVQSNTLSVALTKADVWIVNYEVEYENKPSNSETPEEAKKQEDQSFSMKPTAIANTYSHSTIDKLKTEVEKKAREQGAEQPVIREDIRVETYTRYKDIANYVSNKTESSQYIAKPATVTEKTDGNSKEPNFVTIFNKEKYNKNKRKILSVPSWLFEILETNESTADMVDLIKYLLYKATNKSYGVTEFDFGIYDAKSFSSVSDIKGGNTEEKVWFALRSSGFSEYATAGVMGNIYGESEFDPNKVEGGWNENNGGIGLCQWTNSDRGSTGRNTNLKRYAMSKGSTWQDEDIQIQFLLTELLGSGEANGYASFAFISNGMYDRYYTADDWKNATTIEQATKAFCGTFERPGEEYFYSSMSKRVNAAQGYYNQFQGKDLSDFAGITSGKAKQILEFADSKLGCSYVWGATGPNTFDCSGLTQWCYAQAGITIPRNSEDQLKGAKEVVDAKEAKPGDILYKPGHVGICVSNDNGNIKYIHAPKPGDVVKYGTGSLFTKALRY